MNKLLTFFGLLVIVMMVAPLQVRAADADAPKELVQIPHPEDFATARQVAVQNRLDRIESVQTVMTCIQQATNFEDMRLCKEKEVDAIARLRVEYCATNVGLLFKKHGKKNVPKIVVPKDGDTKDEAVKAETPPEAIEKLDECALAKRAVNGIKLRRSGKPAADAVVAAPENVTE